MTRFVLVLLGSLFVSSLTFAGDVSRAVNATSKLQKDLMTNASRLSNESIAQIEKKVNEALGIVAGDNTTTVDVFCDMYEGKDENGKARFFYKVKFAHSGGMVSDWNYQLIGDSSHSLPIKIFSNNRLYAYEDIYINDNHGAKVYLIPAGKNAADYTFESRYDFSNVFNLSCSIDGSMLRYYKYMH